MKASQVHRFVVALAATTPIRYNKRLEDEGTPVEFDLADPIADLDVPETPPAIEGYHAGALVAGLETIRGDVDVTIDGKDPLLELRLVNDRAVLVV